MTWHADLSREAQKQLARLSRDVRERIVRAIDEFEEKDDSQWSNIKALQGPEWKGRLRKKVGPLPDHFHEVPRSRRRGNLRHSPQVRKHLPLACANASKYLCGATDEAGDSGNPDASKKTTKRGQEFPALGITVAPGRPRRTRHRFQCRCS